MPVGRLTPTPRGMKRQSDDRHPATSTLSRSSTADRAAIPLPRISSRVDCCLRCLARLIDGIIVGIVSLLLIFITDTLSNFWVTGLFTGLLMFVYFLAFEVSRDGRPARSCSA